MRIMSILFVSSAVFFGCSNSENIAKTNVSKYNSVTTEISPQIKIYNKLEDITTIYFKINSSKIIYKIKNELSPPESNLLVNCRVYADKNYLQLVDSMLAIVKDKLVDKGQSELQFNLSCKLPEGKEYHLKIELSDQYGNRSEFFNFIIDKTNKVNRQYFQAMNAKDSKTIVSDYIQNTDSIILQNENFGGNKIICKYYNRFFPLPPPPFSVYQPRPFNYAADSTFTLERNENNQFIFLPKSFGFYHFIIDTLQKEGFTLFKFKGNYPELKNYESLAESVRYLCSSDEYKEISASGNFRTGIENYWLNNSATKLKAKENIRIYYNRIEQSNKLFSSHTQGWKTDRGLIYTIYGSPNIVYKSDFGEQWIYGEETNSLSVRFSFAKVMNPFTDNDYRLSRDEAYKPSWYRIVENWRSGRAY